MKPDKKLLVIIALMITLILPFLSSVNAQSFSVTALLPGNICDNCAEINGDVDNPNNRELTIRVFYKSDNETSYTNKTIIEGITSSSYEIQYVITNLSAGTNYEYYIQAEQIGGDREVFDSEIITFETTGSENILQLDLDDDINKYIITLFLVVGLFLIIFSSIKFAGALILLISGIILLFSSFNVVLSVIIIAGGFTALFLR